MRIENDWIDYSLNKLGSAQTSKSSAICRLLQVILYTAISNALFGETG